MTRSGSPGELYSRSNEQPDGTGYLARSKDDRHQFRIILAPEDSTAIKDLKPFVRDLMAQMEDDLGTKLDWVAVDHFNTGHPHTHVVIRGKDEKGRDLVIARNYIAYGIRQRASDLVTLELGPENELDRIRKQQAEINQERFTNVDRSLLRGSSHGIFVLHSEAVSPQGKALTAGRLKTLARLGLAQERRAGVWALSVDLEPALRAIGERSRKFEIVARTLRDSQIERAVSLHAIFDFSKPRARAIGKVLRAGLVDEMSDRQFVVLDGIDGKVHYAEIGSPPESRSLETNAVVSLSHTSPRSRSAGIEVLSSIELDRLAVFDGPTWLDRILVSEQAEPLRNVGFAGEIARALEMRKRWLIGHGLANMPSAHEFETKPQMLVALRDRHLRDLVSQLSTEHRQRYVIAQNGDRIEGIYERDVITPAGRIAVIRQRDLRVLVSWHPSLHRQLGRNVSGRMKEIEISWTRGRTLSR